MRIWWRCLVKALAVGFLAYFVGNVAQVLNAESCPITEECVSNTDPSEGQILVFTAVVFVLALVVFLVRAYRRKRIWGP